MKIKLPYLIAIVLLVFILSRLEKCDSKYYNPEYWQDEFFKIDTVGIPVPYEVKGDSFEYRVPPIILYRFKKRKDTTSTIECHEDSLISIIDSINNRITAINTDFLKKFPNNPKLIYGLFTKDTISLDLLMINGQIEKREYLTNYNRFKYEFLDNNLNAKQVDDPINSNNRPKNKIKYTGLWLYSNYDILDKKPLVSLDYGFKFKKIKLMLESSATIEKTPILSIKGKLGYKLR